MALVMLLSTPLRTNTGFVLLVIPSVVDTPVSSPVLNTGANRVDGRTAATVPVPMMAVTGEEDALTLPAKSV